MSGPDGTFFRSRWVDAPAGVRELEPGTLPGGFRAAGLACGIKASRRLDIGVVACDDDGATSAALFTRNALVAAAVELSREADLGRLRAVVVNSGNANVATEEQGREVARAMIAAVAGELGDRARPGGRRLDRRDRRPAGPRDRCAGRQARRGGALGVRRPSLLRGHPDQRPLAQARRPRGAARARDRAPLRAGEGRGNDLAQLRDHAVLRADRRGDRRQHARPAAARGGRALLRARLRRRAALHQRLGVRDRGRAFAESRSSRAPTTSAPSRAALDALLRQLALEMVADGEGAERVARLVVRGAVEAVDPVARAVANSPLVKCALHGRRPELGPDPRRPPAQAVPDADLSQLSLYIEDIHVAARGRRRCRSPTRRSQRLDEAMAGARGRDAPRPGARRGGDGDLLLRPRARIRVVQLGVHDVSDERRRPHAAAGASRCCWSRSPTSGSSSAARS